MTATVDPVRKTNGVAVQFALFHSSPLAFSLGSVRHGRIRLRNRRCHFPHLVRDFSFDSGYRGQHLVRVNKAGRRRQAGGRTCSIRARRLFRSYLRTIATDLRSRELVSERGLLERASGRCPSTRPEQKYASGRIPRTSWKTS